jgi:DNA-binding FadR family transcriptional regulator
MAKTPNPQPSPIARQQWKLSDHVYERLFEHIISGEFSEHARLPPETELAALFQVSRPVVREALAKLRDDGIVQSRRGSGSFVTRRPDRAVLRFAPIGGVGDIQRCLEFRCAVEGAAAGLAAVRRNNEDLRAIRAALKDLDACIRSNRVGVDADRQFHLAVCEASKNAFFVSAYESMRTQIEFGMNLALNLSLMRPAERLQLVLGEHVAVYEGIRARAPERAETAMVTHLQNARHRIFEGADDSESA